MNKFALGFARTVKFLAKSIFPIKVYGDKDIPVKKTLLLGNHIALLDPLIMYMVCKKHVHFMYKAELRKSKVLAWFCDNLDMIPVHRGEADMYATKQCLRTLKNNQVLTLFPEGTRNVYVDGLHEFKTGAALFALKTQSPIRPFYIWDRAKPFRRNYIIIGEEMELSEYYGMPVSKVVLQEATSKIEQSVDALRIQLNEILDSKGVKRRKRSKKELARIAEYQQKQLLAVADRAHE